MVAGTTKTEELRALVFAQILRGDFLPGGRIPPEREMAELAGVSRVTVRRAYSALERAGVLQRTQGSGTAISTALRGNSAPPREVALVSAQLDRFSVEFVAAMEAELRERDVLLVLKLTDSAQGEEQAVVETLAKGVFNLVVWPQGGGRLPELARRLRVLGANLVFFDRVFPGPGADFIGLDNADALRRLVEHALAAGCRRLVFVGHSGLAVDSDRARRESFTELCSGAGAECELRELPWAGDQRRAAAALLRKRRGEKERTAFICVNDSVALALRAVAPRLPHLYGIDGLADPRADRIVTVRQPLREFARGAVRLLFEQQKLGERWQAREVLLKGELLEQGV